MFDEFGDDPRQVNENSTKNWDVLKAVSCSALQSISRVIIEIRDTSIFIIFISCCVELCKADEKI